MKYLQLADGIVARYLTESDELTMVRMEFDEGACVGLHEHPHEEVHFAIDGRFEIQLAGSRYRLAKGETVRIPPHTAHSIRNLAGDAALLCVCPGRVFADLAMQGAGTAALPAARARIGA